MVAEDPVHQSSGDFSASKKVIRIFYPDQLKFNSYEELRNEVLSTLIHEETHAMGKNKMGVGIRKKAVKFLSHVTNKRLEYGEVEGYSRGRIHKGEQCLDFDHFNEGVTDIIAEQVYNEYLKRVGDRAMYLLDSKDGFIPTYIHSRALVTAFVEVVALSAEIPSEKVWEAVIQGYMTGLKLDDTELAESFDNIFYKGFIDSIGRGDPVDEWNIPLEEVKLHLAGLKFNEAAKGRIKKAFEALEQEVAVSNDNLG